MRTVLYLCLVLLLAGCGGERPDIVIGSKNFSESVLLGELIAQQIDAHTDLTVGRRLGLGGTFICHRALLAGDLDIYPEYTGTALTAILEQPVMHDPQAVYEKVAADYQQKFKLRWMRPFGFNNTYAMVVRAEDAEREGWKTISDFARVSADRTIGFGFEFAERGDGYQGLVKAYDLRFNAAPKMIDLALVYRALRDREIDLGVGNSTDGVIQAMNLAILEDDRNYFPPYDAAAVTRQQTLDKFPELGPVLNKLAGILTEVEMQKANLQIDGEHAAAADVAKQIRMDKGL